MASGDGVASVPRLNTLAGLPRCRFHDLRHLAASLQLAASVDIAIVSKRLGRSTYHSNPEPAG